jgi:hypothetical protein
MPSDFRYYPLEPPIKWRAGFVGDGPDARPFYFDCCACEAHEPEIAGFVSSDGTFAGIGVIKKPDDQNSVGRYFPAMYCVDCFAKRLLAHVSAHWKPA